MNRKWIWPLGLIGVLCVAFYLYTRNHVAPGIDPAALDLSDLQGNRVSMNAFKGKKILLTFGASWCPNCLDEMQDLDRVKIKEYNDVEIIVVSDEPLETITAFKEAKGYPFTFLKLNKPFGSIGITAVPTSYILNRKLEVMKESVGYVDWKDHSTAQHLNKLME